jgi:hypothetical protein
VERICVAYAGMEKFFPKEKVLLTGNPVRQEVVRLQGSILVAWSTSGWKDGRSSSSPVEAWCARGVNHGVKPHWPRGRLPACR